MIGCTGVRVIYVCVMRVVYYSFSQEIPLLIYAYDHIIKSGLNTNILTWYINCIIKMHDICEISTLLYLNWIHSEHN